MLERCILLQSKNHLSEKGVDTLNRKQLLSEQAVPSLNGNYERKGIALLCNIAVCALYPSARLQFMGVEIVLKLEPTQKDCLSAPQLN